MKSQQCRVGSGSGVLTGFATSNWTIRWEGTIASPVSGTHTLQTIIRSDDGVRLWVDGTLLIDKWTGGSTAVSNSVDVQFTAGTTKNVKIEFLDITNSAALRFNWRIPGTSIFQQVPSAVMNTTGRRRMLPVKGSAQTTIN